jgi:hypothetical protein
LLKNIYGLRAQRFPVGSKRYADELCTLTQSGNQNNNSSSNTQIAKNDDSTKQVSQGNSKQT